MHDLQKKNNNFISAKHFATGGRQIQAVFPQENSALSKCLLCCALSACNRATEQKWSLPSVKIAMRYLYTVLNEEWEVRNIEIALRKLFGGTAQLRNCAP